MDAISQQRLAPLCPSFAIAVTRAISSLALQGVVVRVTAGLRTYAEQDTLFSRGRTAPGELCTKARGGFSNHNFGLAVAMILTMKAEGLEWGGDWVHIPDEDHFQAKSIPPSPDDAMRSCYVAGGMPQVWKTYGFPLNPASDLTAVDPMLNA